MAEFYYKGYTVYSKRINSFGDQGVTYTDKDYNIVYETTNSEGSWDQPINFKRMINHLIKQSKSKNN